MSANSLYKDANDSDHRLKQEWDIYPSGRTGRSSIVTPVSDQRPTGSSGAPHSGARECRYCTETLPPGARECPLCLREVSDPAADRRTTVSQPPTIATLVTLPGSPAPARTSLATAPIEDPPAIAVSPNAAAAAGAVYTLESPVQCPECDTEISTINIVRVLRTQVSFTSTLPRRAYVISCPSCRKLLSAGLSGLV